ncbi:hypothetical protein H696_00811 [Fonticula alba]|uniref:Rab-GAP TBC domain-containing protein n=1 Tax=Fonticula alba TaxID=691883 RepID=A0A058ZFY3_FONAL|nr:hypothetical protein H696_00811 [Fonticula alba]KCV73269.1 hypothetical protein H696_00811 [Fonticula alba]|eukprot:XP_009492970.1 hypothetical protein H696_00811 [Fonticula alba]
MSVTLAAPTPAAPPPGPSPPGPDGPGDSPTTPAASSPLGSPPTPGEDAPPPAHGQEDQPGPPAPAVGQPQPQQQSHNSGLNTFLDKIRRPFLTTSPGPGAAPSPGPGGRPPSATEIAGPPLSPSTGSGDDEDPLRAVASAPDLLRTRHAPAAGPPGAANAGSADGRPASAGPGSHPPEQPTPPGGDAYYLAQSSSTLRSHDSLYAPSFHQEQDSNVSQSDWAFWAEFVTDFDASYMGNARALHTQLLAKGIPHSLRAHLWPALAGVFAASSAVRASLIHNYRILVELDTPMRDQINRDVPRTLTQSVSPSLAQSKSNSTSLSAVLNAYAVYDPTVGYCQGLAFVVHLLLQYMPEEDAFVTLVFLLAPFPRRGGLSGALARGTGPGADPRGGLPSPPPGGMSFLESVISGPGHQSSPDESTSSGPGASSAPPQLSVRTANLATMAGPSPSVSTPGSPGSIGPGADHPAAPPAMRLSTGSGPGSPAAAAAAAAAADGTPDPAATTYVILACPDSSPSSIRSMYVQDMEGLNLRLALLTVLLRKHADPVYSQLERNVGLHVSMFASPWFLTLFTMSWPPAFSARVMDVLLAEGVAFLFRVAVALVRRNANRLLLAIDSDNGLAEVLAVLKYDSPLRVFDHPCALIVEAQRLADVITDKHLAQLQRQMDAQAVLTPDVLGRDGAGDPPPGTPGSSHGGHDHPHHHHHHSSGSSAGGPAGSVSSSSLPIAVPGGSPAVLPAGGGSALSASSVLRSMLQHSPLRTAPHVPLAARMGLVDSDSSDAGSESEGGSDGEGSSSAGARQGRAGALVGRRRPAGLQVPRSSAGASGDSASPDPWQDSGSPGSDWDYFDAMARAPGAIATAAAATAAVAATAAAAATGASSPSPSAGPEDLHIGQPQGPAFAAYVGPIGPPLDAPALADPNPGQSFRSGSGARFFPYTGFGDPPPMPAVSPPPPLPRVLDQAASQLAAAAAAAAAAAVPAVAIVATEDTAAAAATRAGPSDLVYPEAPTTPPSGGPTSPAFSGQGSSDSLSLWPGSSAMATPYQPLAEEEGSPAPGAGLTTPGPAATATSAPLFSFSRLSSSSQHSPAPAAAASASAAASAGAPAPGTAPNAGAAVLARPPAPGSTPGGTPSKTTKITNFLRMASRSARPAGSPADAPAPCGSCSGARRIAELEALLRERDHHAATLQRDNALLQSQVGFYISLLSHVQAAAGPGGLPLPPGDGDPDVAGGTDSGLAPSPGPAEADAPPGPAPEPGVLAGPCDSQADLPGDRAGAPGDRPLGGRAGGAGGSLRSDGSSVMSLSLSDQIQVPGAELHPYLSSLDHLPSDVHFLRNALYIARLSCLETEQALTDQRRDLIAAKMQYALAMQELETMKLSRNRH